MKTRFRSQPVVCRLEEQHFKGLTEKAKERGIGVYELVRWFIIDGLREADAKASLFEQLAFISNEIKEIRHELSRRAEPELERVREMGEGLLGGAYEAFNPTDQAQNETSLALRMGKERTAREPI